MRIPALENNILIYRAIQMAQFLFYAERLRKQIAASVGSTICKHAGYEIKGAKLLKECFKRLENEHLISSVESTEVQDLLAHRNKIAHHIQLLTADIENPGRGRQLRFSFKSQYDYKALERLKMWHDVLLDRVGKNYALSLSFDSLHFATAENAFEEELRRLYLRIDRQWLARKEKLNTKAE